LHRFAPDAEVERCALGPDSSPDLRERHNGRPTRKARLAFIYRKAGHTKLEAFYQADIATNLKLIEILNQGTHGKASPFTENEVRAVLRKVESLVVLLVEIEMGPHRHDS
jgi:Predicted pPIWI-associating nuclease